MDRLELTNPYEDEVMRTLAAMLRESLEPDENLRDVLAGGVALADKRANLLLREAYPLDAEFTFSLWCWWKLKPRIPPRLAEELRSLRRWAFAGVASGDTERLAASVPESTLVLDFEELYRRQATADLRALLSPPPDDEPDRRAAPAF